MFHKHLALLGWDHRRDRLCFDLLFFNSDWDLNRVSRNLLLTLLLVARRLQIILPEEDSLD
jgi:hypothetical protein